jgi:signal transduction histidine kinase
MAMNTHRRSAMWKRVAFPFAALVALGSLLVVTIQHRSYDLAARAELRSLAESNADFLRRTAFTPTEALARDLGRMLHAEVFFRRTDGWIPAPPAAHAAVLAGLAPGAEASANLPGFLAVAARAGDYDLVLLRPAFSLGAILRMPSVLLSLGVFWLTAVGLAILVTQGVVRPLRALARALPDLSRPDAPPADLPGMARHDEIGLVARSYVQTRAQLAEERIRREKAERLAVLGKVSTGLAHEIRNPLAAIRMHAQLLMERPGGTGAGHIVAATNRIESLVRQWLFLARPDAPQRRPLALGALVAERVEELGPALRHAGLEVRVSIPAGLVVAADAARLGQAIDNLVLNSAQAVAGAGRLEIAAQAGPTVSVTFHDSGPGFSATALTHATELFFSEREGGMGVGLAVADEILRAHGGGLRLANHAGGGAVVTVELPRAEAGA